MAHTQFEEKLSLVSRHVQDYCIKAIWGYMLATTIFGGFRLYYSKEATFWSNETALSIAKMLITALVLLIVSMPEGLPLAVSIAMAFSASEFKKDKIVVKDINDYQRCAMVHDIIVSKTGVLTHGNLRVTKYHLCDKPEQTAEGDQDYFTNLPDIVKDCMVQNCDVRIEIAEDKAEYVAKGPRIEEPLIQFLLDHGEDVKAKLDEREATAKFLFELPFTRRHKRQVIIREIP